MRRDWPRQEAGWLLPSCVMDTNEALRQRALRLITLGCSQKIIAAKMGLQASTFSRWVNHKDEIGPVSVTALDGFNAYVQELVAALTDPPDAIRQSGVSGSHTAAPATGESPKKRDGRPLAGSQVPPAVAHGQTGAVPDAARDEVRREAARLERLTGEVEQAGVGQPARAKRTARKHAATARAAAARRRAPARKHRR